VNQPPKKKLTPHDQRFLIAPSLLSADFANLKGEIESVALGGADLLHVDVMDGHFVPNLTIGPPVVQSLRAATDMILDCHLMIEKPERYIEDFVRAGADIITVHIEACQTPGHGVEQVLKQIRSLGVLAGLTLRPATNIREILPYLSQIDLLLVMTVNPGFGGQAFMQDQAKKCDLVRTEIQRQGLQVLIEVDGGINPETAKHCRSADILVAGHAVFKQADRRLAIERLQKAKYV